MVDHEAVHAMWWQRPLVAGCAVAAAVALAAAAMRARRWRSSRGQLIALREALRLRQALQNKLGLDIGGTLAKIVLAVDPAAAGEGTAVREIVTWNDVTTLKDELSFTARSGGFAFAFIETPTETLEETARAIAATVQYPANSAYREIIATGGGAVRFYDMFRSVLQVERTPLKELPISPISPLYLSMPPLYLRPGRADAAQGAAGCGGGAAVPCGRGAGGGALHSLGRRRGGGQPLP